MEKVYKGHPLLVLDEDSRFPFQFGLKKAKLIVENIDEVRHFIKKHDPAWAATEGGSN